jgi:predicted phosphodiesterase
MRDYRFAVLADIHGNLLALEAVLADIRARTSPARPPRLLVAGDFLPAGPHPVEVFERLQAENAVLIRGNNEDYLIDYHTGRAPAWYASSAQMAPMRWTHARLGPERLRFLTGLPDQVVVHADGLPPVRLVHGSHRHISEILIPDQDPMAVQVFRQSSLLGENEAPPPLEDLLSDLPEPVLACGHTHIPWIQHCGERLAFNPGSAGLSSNGDPRAWYALLYWENHHWEVEQRAVAYDLDRLRRAYHDTGYLAAGGPFARGCLIDALQGHNVVWFFIIFARQWASAAGWDGEGAVPDELWFEAERHYPWPQI